MRRKPKLGQNFLVDENAARRIVDALGDISDSTVVEIGPGRGAITGILAPRAKRLICVELDRSLAAALRFRYRDAPHVEILEQDILHIDLSELQGEGPPLRVIGNLPYYITSDILLHLCAHAGAIQTAVVMMQREVADRVAATPGTRDYGVLSVSVQRHSEVSNLFTLPPEAFVPPPEVFSTVVRMTMQDRSAELGIGQDDDTAFLKMLRSVFAQKRKTLGNNLRAAGYSAAQVREACEQAGVAPELRAEALSIPDLAGLYGSLRTQAN